MKTKQRLAAWMSIATLGTVIVGLFGATVATGEGGGRNRFPCTSTTIRPGALLPELVPDQQLLATGACPRAALHEPRHGRKLPLARPALDEIGIGGVEAEQDDGTGASVRQHDRAS